MMLAAWLALMVFLYAHFVFRKLQPEAGSAMGTRGIQKRLYVVVSRPDPEGGRVSYPTDPIFYGLRDLDGIILDDEFNHKHPHCVHAYQGVFDAVDALCRCGLEPYGSYLKVFALIEDKWVFDRAETDRVLDETPW